MKVAVFPLDNLVFFPSSTLPLNIFEPRYIKMIEDALASDTPLSLTYFNPNDATNVVAGVGEVDLLERRDDGTMVILVKGLSRVKLGRVIQSSPYILCEAETLKDRVEISDENQFFLNRLRMILLAHLEDSSLDEDQRDLVASQLDDPAFLVETYVGHQIESAELKQSILELNDINERIRILRPIVIQLS
jgi:Lon protease-like protein